MQTIGFEQALTLRVDDMLDACTKCGACFTACPIAGPAGLGDADPKAVVSGVLDILRFGKGSAESEKWAKACMASGECIKACDYGVNPRFLLTMTRLAIMRNDKDPTERRKAGVMQFRKVGEDTSVLSRLQLSEESLIRLGQRPSKEPAWSWPGSRSGRWRRARPARSGSGARDSGFIKGPGIVGAAPSGCQPRRQPMGGVRC
jgi:L-lactate utilization protein LutB